METNTLQKEIMKQLFEIRQHLETLNTKSNHNFGITNTETDRGMAGELARINENLRQALNIEK